MIRRRSLIAMLAGVAAAWPLSGRAQEAAVPIVGFLNPTSAASYGDQVDAFRVGLGEAGYSEGQNLKIVYRWAEGYSERLPQLAAELVREGANVIAATGEVASARAAQGTSKTIPIVFTVGGDPVKLGLVASWNRPGGNMTGVVILASQLARKEVEIISEIFPPPTVLGLLVNLDNEGVAARADGEAAAGQLGRKLVVVTARTAAELEPAFETLARGQARAVAVIGDPLFLSHRGEMLKSATRLDMAMLWSAGDGAKTGALVGFGYSVPDAYRQAGNYVGQILNGARPAELPVIEASKVRLSINLKTAKALGLTIPSALLARADEVIE